MKDNALLNRLAVAIFDLPPDKVSQEAAEEKFVRTRC
jgi:hypothetical protein